MWRRRDRWEEKDGEIVKGKEGRKREIKKKIEGRLRGSGESKVRKRKRWKEKQVNKLEQVNRMNRE